MMGDSRIAEWGLPVIPGWRVVNSGILGLTSSELRLIAADLLRTHHPRAVVVQAGVNDLKIIGVRGDLKETLIAQCVSNLVDVATLARSQGIRVLITPTWPVGKVPLTRWPVWSSAIPLAIAECNHRLRSALEPFPDVIVLEFFQTSDGRLDPVSHPDAYRDTLHLRAQSYGPMTIELTKELGRVFP
jgi:lysophospholipase L1-like esterase